MIIYLVKSKWAQHAFEEVHKIEAFAFSDICNVMMY